ncbi:lamin tail domain-containing protein [Halorussus ruber]|uniref:lamin tail domain-containing protein n=1 Tax=Halorussus ruber TaxID=1126238 RepID=UPI001091870E|nr:lamin tail domain-containing protein [Halorussus ruber]
MSETKPWATRTTTDYDEIREWAEERDGEPARVVGTGEGEDLGVLRFDFPEEEPDKNLETVAWDAFFEKFESANLALRYQREKKNGEQSYFNRFVRRAETGVADAPEADVSVVAVGSAPVPGADEASEAGDRGGEEREIDAEEKSSPDTDPARGSTAEGVPDEVLDNRRRRAAARLAVGLAVDEIHEDALGYDHWNKNDEYLVFRNEGDEPLDLTGWTVENSDGTTYEFPDEFLLDPRKPVTLHSGSGEDTEFHLYWGAERAIWKNTGDVVTVRDDEERRVIRESY